MLLEGEKEAVKQVLDAGAKYGYGNMIAWLRRGWSDLLMKNGFTQEQADHATMVSPYSRGAIEHLDEENTNKNLWHGYIHVNGNLHVKRFFSADDIDRNSPFVEKYLGPVKANTREEAVEKLLKYK